MEASGQLERLMRSDLRHCDKFAVIDAHAAGEIEVVAVPRIGPIRGRVFCSFLALLLKVELEQRMEFADLEREWAQVLRGLEALQQVEATFEQRRFILRSQLTDEASAALRAAGVAASPTLRELP